jgi:glycerol-3-phosphate acyltransferase PlsY
MHVSWLLVLFGYLLGSCTSAVLVCRVMGLADPRQTGSGNPGTTNVLRIGGKKAALLTLILDITKGFLPVLLANHWAPELSTFVMLAAFLGHLYPVFFRFAGGKGVATAFGGLLAWQWPLALLVLSTWLLTVLLFRYSSLGALSAAIGTLCYIWASPTWTISWPVTLMVGLLLWRHRENIIRLMKNEEPMLNFKVAKRR